MEGLVSRMSPLLLHIRDREPHNRHNPRRTSVTQTDACICSTHHRKRKQTTGNGLCTPEQRHTLVRTPAGVLGIAALAVLGAVAIDARGSDVLASAEVALGCVAGARCSCRILGTELDGLLTACTQRSFFVRPHYDTTTFIYRKQQ